MNTLILFWNRKMFSLSSVNKKNYSKTNYTCFLLKKCEPRLQSPMGCPPWFLKSNNVLHFNRNILVFYVLVNFRCHFFTCSCWCFIQLWILYNIEKAWSCFVLNVFKFKFYILNSKIGSIGKLFMLNWNLSVSRLPCEIRSPITRPGLPTTNSTNRVKRFSLSLMNDKFSDFF